MKLIYSKGEGFVTTANGDMLNLTAKPELGFEYDGIFYNTDTGASVHLRGAGQCALTPDEIGRVRTYINSLGS